jgi:hypothetical protein
MKTITNLSFSIILLLFVLACGLAGDEKTEVDIKNENTSSPKTTPQKTPETKKTVKIVDVPKLADKSPKKFDEIFGEPVKVTEIKDNPRLMPGEFREYRVDGHPKNLSVRFYKNKAKRFNLLLGKSEKSSSNSLKKIFKIDVGGMRRIQSDALSETWTGKSGRIDYKTAYAKRSKSGGDFVMLHAEIQ